MKNSEFNQSKGQSQRKCRLCKTQFTGRSHKIFCSATCKAQYHIKLNKVTMDAAERINTILLRNRSILLEIMGKNAHQKTVPRALLDSKKFHFGYMTHFFKNSENKTSFYVYDFSWSLNEEQDVLIKKVNSLPFRLDVAA
jgi:hypothetical protein